MMVILTNILGVAVYIGMGALLSKMTTDHIYDLYEKVWAIKPQYAKRLWFHIPIALTKTNKFLVELAFMVIWPVFCIAAILKAEREYDLIVHHSAFTTKRVP